MWTDFTLDAITKVPNATIMIECVKHFKGTGYRPDLDSRTPIKQRTAMLDINRKFVQIFRYEFKIKLIEDETKD